MTSVPPPDRSAATDPGKASPSSSAVERANRMSASNMIRSLVPLVIICLAVVGWLALGRQDVDPVREIDPSGSIAAAAAEAGYPLQVPQDLPRGYRPTDTDLTGSNDGSVGPLTLGIDYVTPDDAYAGFVVSDDPAADAVTDVLDGAGSPESATVGGREWTRAVTRRGETVLFRTDGEVTVLVTGDAEDDELETVAGAVTPYTR